MNIWIISDTHFYHENIIRFENRPVDHVVQIIKNWNKLVKPEDLVIHLGDVIFGQEKQKNLTSLLASLPGKKVLCRGNHDAYPEATWGHWEWFMECGFDMVCDYFIYKDMAFSHAPLTPLPTQTLENHGKEVRLNLHGHFHRKNHRSPEGKEGVFTDTYYDAEYYMTHVEKYKRIQIEDELRPFLLEEVLTW